MESPRTEPFNPPPRRSAIGGVAALLALLALAASGYAVWSARGNAEAAVNRTEVDQLRAEVDSLRLQMQQMSSPFGPTAGAQSGSSVNVPPTAGTQR